MAIIDAKNKFTTRHLLKFKSELSPDTMVNIVSEKTDLCDAYNVNELRKFFDNDVNISLIVADDDVISFIADDNILEFSGLDFKWWTKTIKGVRCARLDKLFDEVTIKEKSETEKKTTSSRSAMYDCYIGYLKDGSIEDVQHLNAKRADMIEFINKRHSQIQLKYDFAYKTMIALSNEIISQEALSKSDTWKTFEKLSEEGVLVLCD